MPSKTNKTFKSLLFKESGWDAVDVGWLLTIGMEVLVIRIGLRTDTFEIDGIEHQVLKFNQFLNLEPSGMGDTFAGIFSALAFVWILVTVFLQSAQLKEQKSEISRQANEFEKMNESMERQRLEQTFFEMLHTHGHLIGEMSDQKAPGKPIEGREALGYIQGRLFTFLRGKTSREDVLIGYAAFWKKYRKDLSHYFRFLYNFFRFLEEKAGSDEFYAKVLRSQLSNEELTLLYYNCLSPDGEKMEKYAKKFEVFDNIDIGDFCEKSHKELLNSEVFGEKTARKLGL